MVPELPVVEVQGLNHQGSPKMGPLNMFSVSASKVSGSVSRGTAETFQEEVFLTASDVLLLALW